MPKETTPGRNPEADMTYGENASIYRNHPLGRAPEYLNQNIEVEIKYDDKDDSSSPVTPQLRNPEADLHGGQ